MTSALIDHSIMLATGPPAHTRAEYGLIEQLVAGRFVNGRTPCNQFVKPPTLPPSAKQAKACPLSWMSPKIMQLLGTKSPKAMNRRVARHKSLKMRDDLGSICLMRVID
jgi:hypothetical protein